MPSKNSPARSREFSRTAAFDGLACGGEKMEQSSWLALPDCHCSRCDMTQITRLLDAAAQGDGVAAEQLLPLVYDELRRLATARMACEVPNQTLQPTALVHEAWMRV